MNRLRQLIKVDLKDAVKIANTVKIANIAHAKSRSSTARSGTPETLGG